MNFPLRIYNLIKSMLSSWCNKIARGKTAANTYISTRLAIYGKDNKLQLARKKCIGIGQKWEVLQISLTDNCNLLCRHCFRAKRYIGPELSLRSFAFFLGNFHPDCFERLLLSDWGEVSTVKNLFDYLRYAKSTGWKQINVVTNATLLNEEKIETIMRERLISRFTISLEAASQNIYEHIRGASWRRFLNNLELLKRKKDEQKSHTEIILGVCCFQYNLEELPKIVDLAAQYGVNEVHFVHLNPIPALEEQKDAAFYHTEWRRAGISPSDKLCLYEQHLDNEDRSKVIAVFASVIEKAVNNRIKILLPEKFPGLSAMCEEVPPGIILKDNWSTINPDYACNWPFRWVQVHLNGRVFPCCQMGKVYSFGNLYHSPFYKIWRSERAVQFIKGLQHRHSPAPVCRNCNIYRGKRF